MRSMPGSIKFLYGFFASFWWIKLHCWLQECQTEWATFTKRDSSYKSTLMLDSMTPSRIVSSTINRRLSWSTSILVSFRLQRTSNMVFYLLDLLQWPHVYIIILTTASLNSTHWTLFCDIQNRHPFLTWACLVLPAVAKVVGYALTNS